MCLISLAAVFPQRPLIHELQKRERERERELWRERERERESGSVTQNEKVRKDKISIRRF